MTYVSRTFWDIFQFELQPASIAPTLKAEAAIRAQLPYNSMRQAKQNPQKKEVNYLTTTLSELSPQARVPNTYTIIIYVCIHTCMYVYIIYTLPAKRHGKNKKKNVHLIYIHANGNLSSCSELEQCQCQFSCCSHDFLPVLYIHTYILTYMHTYIHTRMHTRT